MITKNIKYFFIIISLCLIIPVFIQAADEAFPVLPGIKSIKVTGTSKVGYQGRAGKIERMAEIDGVQIAIEKEGGGAYPDTVSYKGKNWPVTLKLEVTRGDGATFASGSGGGGIGYKNISNGLFGFGVSDVPKTKVSSSDRSGKTTPLASTTEQYENPVPGPVRLNVTPEAWLFWRTEPCYSGVEMAPCGPTGYNNQQQIWGSESETIYAFTIAPPPKITSANKTSVKHEETITLTGENFDDTGAVAGWLYGDAILFNYDTTTKKLQRTINNTGEDYVHYCSATKLKFEVPSDLSSGTYQIRLRNEWGLSNSLQIEVQNGTGTREYDSTCVSSAVRQITSISPTSGPVGTIVTIKGKGFGSATSGANANVVKFNGVQSQVVGVNLDRTQIQATVPQGASTGPVTVAVPGFSPITGPVFTVTSGSGSSGTVGPIISNFINEIKARYQRYRLNWQRWGYR